MRERAPIEFETFTQVTKRWMFLSVYPTREGGISIYFRDVSEQKRIESELTAAKLEAERANQAKSKFLAAASHDLRQPVQSLVLLMAVAERQIPDNAQALDTLGRMRGALEGLTGLLSAILDISRFDAGVETQPRGDRSRRPRSAVSRTNTRRRPTSCISLSGSRLANSGPGPIRPCWSAPCAT